MAKKNTIQGFKKVIDNLNKEVKKIKGRTLKGLIEGAIIIRRDMEVTPPVIPIDLGNLRASWFTVTAQSEQGGAPEFKGVEAARLSSGHDVAVSEAKALAQTIKDPVVVMGFSANYAMAVHENVDADFTSPRKRRGKIITRRSGAGAKFFEKSLQRNTDAVLQVIAKNAQIR